MSVAGEETLHPRRNQMDMTITIDGMNIPGAATNLSDTVIVDYASQTLYMKMSGSPLGSSGQWYKMSLAALSGLGGDTSLYMDYSKLKDAKLIGSETINGVAVWHLRAKEQVNSMLPSSSGVSAGSGGGQAVDVNATSDYYFRQDNYRPVKVVIAATETSAAFSAATVKGEMDFTAFNTGVSIALPKASEVQPLP
jgi:hypothetical protein